MIGRNIRYYRLLRRMTQSELAQVSGVSRSAISCYESLKRTPDNAAIQKLARALQVTTAQLLFSFTDNLKLTHGALH